MAELKVRLIVPRREDGGHRDRLWDFCRRYWQKERPKWELAEGAHTEGMFNRSAAINKAAEGQWDVAVILDSDTILDIEPIDKAIDIAHWDWRLVLPFSTRCLLNRAGTQQILDGYKGSWERFVSARQCPGDAYIYISGCQVVARELWDAIGGFDERFETYGGEDDAFHAASVALTGIDAREDRLPGNAWHLWHRHSPDARNTPARKLVKALAERYTDCAWDRERMKALLSEPRSTDQTVVSILTCPGRDTLPGTVASIEEELIGPIGRKIICLDAEEPDFDPFQGWETIPMGTPEGFVKAMRSCWYHEMASGQPWVAHFEDDVLLNEPVDISELQRIMDSHSDLAQLSLKRQPWHPEELEAGDMLKWRPEGTFLERDGHIAHRAFWTATFSLMRRSLLAEYDWPAQSGSERRFGRQLFRQADIYSGIYGGLDDPPRLTHVGETRAGYGY